MHPEFGIGSKLSRIDVNYKIEKIIKAIIIEDEKPAAEKLKKPIPIIEIDAITNNNTTNFKD